MSGAALAPAVLLDTCAVIWLANGDRMEAASMAAILHACRADGTFVSPVSAWEIGMLSRRTVEGGRFVRGRISANEQQSEALVAL